MDIGKSETVEGKGSLHTAGWSNRQIIFSYNIFPPEYSSGM
jgi:hypothetical protein